MTDENAHYPKSATGQPVTLEQRGASQDGRRFSPSTGRNKQIVCDVFLAHMPTTGEILEIASGTGEHGACISEAASDLRWTYSDIDPDGHISQRAWAEHAAHQRLIGPLELDTTRPDWGNAEQPAGWDGLFCANMIHIAPFAAAEGLIAGAGRLLRAGGRVMLYGPFARNGVIAPSNARFREDLQRRDPRWGVRDLDQEILPLSEAAGLKLAAVVEMPANNLSVIFERT